MYRLECAPTTTFQDPPPIEHETAAFKMNLCDGQVRFDLKQHFGSVQAARESLAGFLRAWEIDAGLKIGPGEVRFVYDRAGVSDRAPRQPGGPDQIWLEPIESGSMGDVFISAKRSSDPAPPTSFVASPTVETLWQRDRGYEDRREPLSSMAYFCLTMIEYTVSNRERRRKTAEKYAIGKSVLDKLAVLTERRGDPTTARKADTNFDPHTGVEIAWIEAVVKAIIRRVAEVEAGVPVSQITMSDFPTL